MHLSVAQPVHYRYLSYPIGIVKQIDQVAKKVLLEVDHAGCKFTRWVSQTSVNPELKPNTFRRFLATRPCGVVDKNQLNK